MQKTTNAEVLAAWLIFASRSGPDGRIMPTDAEVSAIMNERPPRWDEACALSEALVKRVITTEPKTMVGATMDFLGKINEMQEKVGGFMGTPPASGRTK